LRVTATVKLYVRIEATDLPGRDCGPSPDVPSGYHNIHVAVQQRGRPDELYQLHPADAPSAVWVLDCTPSPIEDCVDIQGPQIQGPRGGRFVYLSWGTVDKQGTFTMFRRAKLMFDAVDTQLLRAAIGNGQLVARLGLTDHKGHPLCAAVRPPLVSWST
jgi:hypothetical protein